jgi:hypothetical protein
MQPNFEAGVWLVAGCGGKKYVGKARERKPVEPAGSNVATGHMYLDEAIELITMVMPVQGPQGMGINRIVICQPIDGCSGPSTIEIVADYCHWFMDMNSDDLRRHKGIVEAGLAQMTEARAREAGLVLPHVRPT